jgi:hypothetical protein
MLINSSYSYKNQATAFIIIPCYLYSGDLEQTVAMLTAEITVAAKAHYSSRLIYRVLIAAGQIVVSAYTMYCRYGL